ncbi:MAG: hypothetical protein U1U88_001260 [Lawsonella clevelandensis]
MLATWGGEPYARSPPQRLEKEEANSHFRCALHVDKDERLTAVILTHNRGYPLSLQEMTGEVDSTLKGRAAMRYGISRISFVFPDCSLWGCRPPCKPTTPCGGAAQSGKLFFGAQAVLFVLSMRHVVPRQEHEK